VIAVPCKKKGGFKVPGADKAVNSNEKRWVISTFSEMGTLILFSLFRCIEFQCMADLVPSCRALWKQGAPV